MLRNYLAAALRNLARNRLYAAVTIAGLAIGFAAALLIGLYVRDELTFDRFVPGHERVYLVSETIVLSGAKPIDVLATPTMLAAPLKQDFAEIETVARLTPAFFPVGLRRGQVSATEQRLFWADPDFFRVMPLPVVAGDLSIALAASDGVVLTRAMARKYFGRDAPLGEILQIENRPYRVTAVLKDLPSNTHLTGEIFVSSRSPASPISQYQAASGPLSNTVGTYFRLRPGASIRSMEPRLASFLESRLPLTAAAALGPVKRTLHLVPLTRVHLTAGATTGKPPADPAVIAAIGVVGVLIVVVAAINFVTLMTARAARRAVEVGVRKAAGARRSDLVLQFMSEAFLYVLAAAVLAVAAAELLMPAAGALLQRRLAFDYLQDPALATAILVVVVLTALLAGAYPAFVLSSFRPSSVLKGGPLQATGGGGGVRQTLVVGQFAVLVGLMLVAITIARQTLYALNEGQRLDKEQVLLVFSQPCIAAFRDQALKIPGVQRASCASYQSLNLGDNRDEVPLRGRMVDLATAPVDFGFFEVFGVKPLAGRLFASGRAADGALDSPDHNPPVILNATATRRLGFASPEAAVGKSLNWHGLTRLSSGGAKITLRPLLPSEIVGVVPDFTLGSVREPILPTVYAIGRNEKPESVGMVVKLDGRRTPEALAAIDRLWSRFVADKPIFRVFIDRFTLRLYVDTIIQGATVAIAAVIALTIASLGLFALSAYTTERRTKEIGVRKAMGASSADILRLLLWQFTKPVIWANLIAWPAAYLVLRWWLSAFAYHVEPAPWTFAAAGGGALLIAWGTVFVHALNVARSKPAQALRYE